MGGKPGAGIEVKNGRKTMCRRMAVYRGSLRSCNYSCTYCPFSKRRMSGQELEKDREQWFSFVRFYTSHAKASGFRALMVAPYGEALIHPWYWEGLARISVLSETDAVGAQTNLSFPVQQSLGCFADAGGIMGKLKLWATFHPQMAGISKFTGRCRQLLEKGVGLSVGVVGVPGNLKAIQQLRMELPKEVYVWINKMDGLGRPYSQDEVNAFLSIDPYFFRELQPSWANASQCQGRFFAEGDGRLRLCNISPVIEERWEDGRGESWECGRGERWEDGRGERWEDGRGESWECGRGERCESSWEGIGRQRFKPCSRKRCSCYLAYGGRETFMNQMLFGPYPLFRIPRRPKAVFLDIEGTLLHAKGTLFPGADVFGCPDIPEDVADVFGCPDIPEDVADVPGCPDIPEDVVAGLEAVAKEKAALFFATTLPYAEAMKRCRKVRHLFRGGIFAGGAHILLEGAGKKSEYFYYLDEGCISYLGPSRQRFHCRILACREGGKCYKVTLLRSVHRHWDGEEAEEVMGLLPLSCREQLRYFIEGNCLQIAARQADKANGVRMLCRWLQISPKDAFAAGDSGQDVGMVELCGD